MKKRKARLGKVKKAEKLAKKTPKKQLTKKLKVERAKTKRTKKIKVEALAKEGKKSVYYFGDKRAEGDGKMKDLLGGKGAGLAEMTRVGASVPSGFTITTEACRLFYQNDMRLPRPIENEIRSTLKKVERSMGARFGDVSNPLLLSVRSGAKFSMPGMMDTVLNIGLDDKTAQGLAKKSQTVTGDLCRCSATWF